MGNSNSGGIDFEYNLTASDYTPSHKFQDFLFGEFYEVKHNTTGENFLLKIRVLNDSAKYQQMIENAYHRVSLAHSNLVKIQGFAGKEASTSSAVAYKLYLYFRPLPRDLAKLLKSRKNTTSGQGYVQSKLLPEAELFNIMFQLIDLLDYLQGHGISHGDIRPEACFIDDDGKVMLCDRKLIYEEDWDYKLEKEKEKNYLFSPIAFEAFVKREQNTRENKHKGDVFSVGMTLLECATFKRSSHIYEWGSHPAINQALLISRLTDMQARYSSKFCQLLAEMLRFEENLRPDFPKLKKWITGSEPIGFTNLYASPLKNNEVGPQLIRNSIGPKLAGSSPKGFKTGIKINGFEAGKLALKTLSKEEGPFATSPDALDSGRLSKRGGKDEEDEIVEFETEEASKKSIQDYNHSTHGSTNLNSNSSNALAFKESEVSFKNLESRYGMESNTAYGQGYISSTQYTAPKTSDFPRIDEFMDKKNKYNLLETIPSYTSANGVDFTSGYSYNKDLTSNRILPSTDDLLRRTHDINNSNYNCISQPKNNMNSSDAQTLSPTKGYVPDNYKITYTNASPNNKNSVAPENQSPAKIKPPKLEIDSPLTAGTYGANNSLLSHNGVSQVYMSSKMPSESLYATQNYGEQIGKKNTVEISPFLLTPLKISKQDQCPSPTLSHSERGDLEKSIGGYSRGENSIWLDGDAEQWRSLVADGLSYSTVLSAGPNSPKQISGSCTDLLDQQLKGLSQPKQFSQFNQLNRTRSEINNKAASEAYLKADSMRNSVCLSESPLLNGTTSHLSPYGKLGSNTQHSTQTNYLSGCQTPSNQMSYNSTSAKQNYEADRNTYMSSAKNNEMDDMFKRAMDRSRQTYDFIRSRDSLRSSISEDVRNPNKTIADQIVRNPIQATGYRNY